ncbi:hypothetical protein [Novosphingobium guangzhouense]|uniref:hypothetical protein n=1 Tax=Novosphingobium guangzhouense TaxID=1850347 RepID=UPI0011AFB5E3|nr:hypothetical protein [Novosphingobium guangzhouense]
MTSTTGFSRKLPAPDGLHLASRILEEPNSCSDHLTRDERLIARVDLGAERTASTLLVCLIQLVSDTRSHTHDPLNDELLGMADWLELAEEGLGNAAAAAARTPEFKARRLSFPRPARFRRSDRLVPKLDVMAISKRLTIAYRRLEHKRNKPESP